MRIKQQQLAAAAATTVKIWLNWNGACVTTLTPTLSNATKQNKTKNNNNDDGDEEEWHQHTICTEKKQAITNTET